MTLDASQIRAARALLDWTIEDLAKITGLSKDSIKNVERGHTQPRINTRIVIEEAFEKAGIEFLPGSGVRKKNNLITTLTGEYANRQLLDDVYATLVARENACVYITGVKETQSIDSVDYEYLEKHIQRLLKANIKEKLIVEEGDSTFIAPSYSYRWIAEQYFENVPIQVYGDKIAFVDWGPPEQIVIIQNKGFAMAMQKLLDFAWQNCAVPKGL